MSLRRRIALLVCVALVIGNGCDSSTPPSVPPTKKPARQTPAATAAASGQDAGPTMAEAVVFRDDEFVETELSRDPFRSFSKAFGRETAATVQVQREVLLERYALDELKLVAIVRGGTEPRAMFIDPLGVGWIVHRGQLIGKAEIVHGVGPSGARWERNWRVDRIRDGDVVLIGDALMHTEIAPEIRVIPLRNEETASLGR